MDGQVSDVGHMKLEPHLVDLSSLIPTDEEQQEIRSYAMTSQTRKNLAVRLVRHYFCKEELEGKNCFGRRNKEPLDPVRLGHVKSITFLFFPLPEGEERRVEFWWNICTRAIDTYLRGLKRNKKFYT